MKKFALFVVSVALAMTLAACAAGGPSTTIDVIMTDFHYSPDSFVVPAGQELTFKATNNGAVVHNFVIMKYGTTVGDDFDSSDEGNIFWEAKLEPGESVSSTFTAPTDVGDYQVICRTPGHFVAGMLGKLTVVAP